MAAVDDAKVEEQVKDASADEVQSNDTTTAEQPKVELSPKDDAGDDDKKVDSANDNVTDDKKVDASSVGDDEKESKSPEMMKAIYATARGDVDKVLQIKDVPIPAITNPNQVLVKIYYSAINPIDYKIVTGLMGPASSKKPEHIPGNDFCGVIVAKGTSPELERLEVGDMVFGNGFDGTGSFAQYAVMDAKCMYKLPSNLDPAQAAAVPLVTQTSWQALEKLKVNKNTKLLIFGGSTSTGLMASQIAKRHIGCAEVIVTSSQEELCKKCGADRVINYKTEKWEEVLKDYGLDAIYDCVGGVDYWNKCRSEKVLKKSGRYVTIVGDTAHVGKMTVGTLVGSGLSLANRKFWSSMGYQSYDMVLTDNKKNMDDIAKMIEAGKLEAVLDPDSPYKFEDYLKMFEKSMSHRAKGKLVIQIASDEEMEKQISNPSDDVKEEEKENSDVPKAEETTTVESATEQKEEAVPAADDNATQEAVDDNAVEDDNAVVDNNATEDRVANE